MCDYSLENQVSRAAKAGDRLTTTGFYNSSSRGFCAVGARDVAVCLLPGTELAFDRPINHRGLWGLLLQSFQHESRTARFRQVNLDIAGTHHDALELDNGRIVLLTHLREGQHATVLQLPAGSSAGDAIEGVEYLALETVE